MSQMFAGDVFKAPLVAELGQRLDSKTGGQQDQRDLLCNLIEEQNRIRRLAARMGELNEKDVVCLGFQLLHALWQVQYKIRSDRELTLLEFLQATINCVRIPVYEKYPERTRSVGLCCLSGGTPRAKLVLSLSPLRNGSHNLYNHQTGPHAGGEIGRCGPDLFRLVG